MCIFRMLNNATLGIAPKELFYIDQKHSFVPLDRQETWFPVTKMLYFIKNKYSSQITNEEPNQRLRPTGGEEQVKGKGTQQK